MNALAKSLELSSCAAARVGPKIAQAVRAEGVDDAGGERRLGPDDRERDRFLARERDEFGNRRRADVDERLLARRARVARRDVHARHARALRELPGERVLAAAAADDEDVHGPIAGRARRLEDRGCAIAKRMRA